MEIASVYILLCSDGSYYTGKTQLNIEQRFWQHQHGVYKGYTYYRRPLQLVWTQRFPTYIEAISAERRIKKWSRLKKEALINGDFDLLHQLAECKNDSHYKRKMK